MPKKMCNRCFVKLKKNDLCRTFELMSGSLYTRRTNLEDGAWYCYARRHKEEGHRKESLEHLKDAKTDVTSKHLKRYHNDRL